MTNAQLGFWILDLIGNWKLEIGILGIGVATITLSTVLTPIIEKKESTVHIAGLVSAAPGPVTQATATQNIPNDPEFPKQDYLLRINAPQGWSVETGKQEIVVAVLDSGVDIDHPDLTENIWKNPDEIPGNGIDDDANGYIDDVRGWDFVAGSPDPRPKFDEGYTELGVNHGTIVAGVLAARGNNSQGIAGVAWRAKIMPLRVLNGAGEGLTDAVARAIDYARREGARIINLSFVGHDSSVSMTEAIDRAWKAGLLIVAAAGNEVRDGINLNDQPAYPICQDGARGENKVFGVTSVDHADRLASFSNYGSRCIDVSAPGVSIFSTLVYRPGMEDFRFLYSGWWSGTSVAAPQVSGLAALIWSLRPELSLAQVQNLIKEYAVDIDNFNPRAGGHIGRGRINVAASLTRAASITREELQYPQPSRLPAPAFVVSSPRASAKPEVRIYDHKTSLISSWYAYNQAVKMGVEVAAGDVDGDRELDVVTGVGPGVTPQVNVYSLQGKLKSGWLAYAPGFLGGVRVAAGDVDGDGVKEIITGAGPGGGPHVRIFDLFGNLKGQFMAYDPASRHGIEIAAADIDGDGTDEILTAPSQGAQAYVRIFSHPGLLRRELLVFPPTFLGGVSIAGGDFDGNGVREIVVGAGKGGGAQIRIINRNGEVRAQWFAYPNGFRGGIRVATGDLNGDGRDEVIVAPLSGGGPHVRVFTSAGHVMTQFFAFDKSFRGGVNVASGF